MMDKRSNIASGTHDKTVFWKHGVKSGISECQSSVKFQKHPPQM